MRITATSALWLLLVALFGVLLSVHYGAHYGRDKDLAIPTGGSRSPTH